MNDMLDGFDEEPSNRRPTHAEVERLCILHVVPPDGLSANELTRRLGISEAHAQDLLIELEPMVAGGLLERCDAGVRRTEAGTRQLDEVAEWLSTVRTSSPHPAR